MLLNIKTFLFYFLCLNLSAQVLPKGFVFLDEEIPNIKVELRYATKNNFTGKIMKAITQRKRQ